MDIRSGGHESCTGVGTAFLDRAPVLAFTTEAPERMRHRTLQMHIDHQALFRPLTKWTTRLQAANLRQTLRRAVQVATAEVPGPVHLGLPEDLGPQPMVLRLAPSACSVASRRRHRRKNSCMNSPATCVRPNGHSWC